MVVSHFCYDIFLCFIEYNFLDFVKHLHSISIDIFRRWQLIGMSRAFWIMFIKGAWGYSIQLPHCVCSALRVNLCGLASGDSTDCCLLVFFQWVFSALVCDFVVQYGLKWYFLSHLDGFNFWAYFLLPPLPLWFSLGKANRRKH